MAKKLSTREVKAILSGEKADSLSASAATKLSNDRTTALNYYLGDMSADFPTVKGRSNVISTDVSDCVDGLIPGLMDIFAGGEEVVRFDPVGPEDMPAAEQETQYVNHIFMQKNPGFRILQTMFKDGLISKTGVVKVWWEEKDSEELETYLNQDEESFTILVSKPDFNVVAHTANEDGTHDVTLMKSSNYGCAKVCNVPPEEFGVSKRTRDLQDTPYCFHEPGGGMSESDLIDEGYDSKQIKGLSSWTESGTRGTEAIARDSVGENTVTGGGSTEARGQRMVQITEHYIRMDYEGKGKSYIYKCVTGGEEGDILNKNGSPDIERIDYIPFAVGHPDPIPHRFFGRSIADKAIETQRVKTVLMRGVLDNIYLINNQQMEVNEQMASDSTIDDLLNRRIGGIVRTKGPGAVNPIVVQHIADKIFPAIEYFDREREWRTGVTREGQGLDAESLQNQSATAARQTHTAAQAKMKMIARNFADGVEDLFWLLHSVIRKNGSKPETVRLRNNWVAIDPRQWRSRDDMTVMVGLGTGGKQDQLAGLQMLIQAQMSAAENPKLGLVAPKHFYNSAKDMVRLLDKKDVNLYFNDPGEAPMPEPPPDPKIQATQMQGQLEQQKLQASAEIEKIQAQADTQVQITKAQTEAQLAQQKFELEKQIKMIELEMETRRAGLQIQAETQKHGIEMVHQQQAHAQKMTEMQQQQAMKREIGNGAGKKQGR